MVATDNLKVQINPEGTKGAVTYFLEQFLAQSRAAAEGIYCVSPFRQTTQFTVDGYRGYMTGNLHKNPEVLLSSKIAEFFEKSCFDDEI